MPDNLDRDGGPHLDPSVRAVIETSHVVATFNQALAFANTSGACVQIAERIGFAVKILIQAQDRALAKANQL